MEHPMPSRFKYQHVVDVLLAANEGDSPQALAARVRERDPKGAYPTVRICEDIDRVIHRRDVFRDVHLTPEQRARIRLLRDRMKDKGAWYRRGDRGALKEAPY